MSTRESRSIVSTAVESPALRPVTSGRWLLAGAVIAGVAACYARVFSTLADHWASNDMYNHGFLIPIISAYIVWERRAQLAHVPVVPAERVGALTLAAGLAVLIAGQLGSVAVVQQLSLLVTLTGLVLLLFGWTMLRALWLPLAYLALMIPVWEVVLNRLHAPFQQLSAEIGAFALSNIGVPVRLQGVFVELPNVTLEVAEVCSGVNFLVAIVAISVPQAYLMLSGTWRRLFVLASSVGVVLLSNGFRVALIGWLAYYGYSGPDIHGPGHMLQGLFVAAMGFAVMTGLIRWLAAREARRRAPETRAADAPRAAAGWSLSLAARPAAVAVAILGVAVALIFLYRTEPVEARVFEMALVDAPAKWGRGVPAPPPSFFERSGVDHELSRAFLSPSGRPVQLYAGYFRYQVQAKELVNANMSELHKHASPVALRLASGAELRVNEAVYTKDGRSRYIVFWYDINGRKVTNRYGAKGWTIWDSATRRRSNGGVVMVSADLGRGGDPQAVAAEVRTLAAAVAPRLDGAFPR